MITALSLRASYSDPAYDVPVKLMRTWFKVLSLTPSLLPRVRRIVQGAPDFLTHRGRLAVVSNLMNPHRFDDKVQRWWHSEERAIAEPPCLAARGVANHNAARARRVAQQLQHAYPQPNQNTLSRSADR